MVILKSKFKQLLLIIWHKDKQMEDTQKKSLVIPNCYLKKTVFSHFSCLPWLSSILLINKHPKHIPVGLIFWNYFFCSHLLFLGGLLGIYYFK